MHAQTVSNKFNDRKVRLYSYDVIRNCRIGRTKDPMDKKI